MSYITLYDVKTKRSSPDCTCANTDYFIAWIISIVRMNRYVIKSLQIALATYSSSEMIISIVRMNRYVIKSLTNSISYLL